MSKIVLIDLRGAGWRAIHESVLSLIAIRQDEAVYAGFIVDKKLLAECNRLIKAFTLQDVCEASYKEFSWAAEKIPYKDFRKLSQR